MGLVLRFTSSGMAMALALRAVHTSNAVGGAFVLKLLTVVFNSAKPATDAKTTAVTKPTTNHKMPRIASSYWPPAPLEFGRFKVVA
jgi:hypothetical protein